MEVFSSGSGSAEYSEAASFSGSFGVGTLGSTGSGTLVLDDEDPVWNNEFASALNEELTLVEAEGTEVLAEYLFSGDEGMRTFNGITTAKLLYGG